ncbi:cystatin-8 isoform X2 [Vicugna pacos]|uniref:Cystatin-8 isoform X2 n=1 Tax=Vicugna pacos TaxID=30538 RepID=A0A6I9IQB3_VICPA|nr:cystatin-8 [Vicugna pacos]
MTRPWGARLLLLTIPLALVDSADLDNMKVKVLRELKKVSPSSANVRQCLWFAMQEFNRESAEKHLFQVVKVLQVHLQVTDCLENLIEADTARTNCRKLCKGSESCVPKGNPRPEEAGANQPSAVALAALSPPQNSGYPDLLLEIQRCTFLVGALPWHSDFTVMRKECVDV